MVLAGEVSTVEVVAGLSAGLAATLLWVAARRTGKRQFRLRSVPWVLLVTRSAVTLATDTARVASVLAQAVVRGPDRVRGAVTRQPFAPGSEDAHSATRRALVTLCVCLTPNSYALAIGRDAMRVHRLAPREPSDNRDWPL